MIKVKNILLIAFWIAIPATLYFAHANEHIVMTNWPPGLIKLKNLVLYGLWPVIPLIFVSRPRFQFVQETDKKWRSEVPIKNDYQGFGIFGLVSLMVLSLALYFFRSDAFIIPSEIFIALILALGIFVYRNHQNNGVIQQFFSFSSDLDYDYNDLHLRMKNLEKDSLRSLQGRNATDNNNNIHS